MGFVRVASLMILSRHDSVQFLIPWLSLAGRGLNRNFFVWSGFCMDIAPDGAFACPCDPKVYILSNRH